MLTAIIAFGVGALIGAAAGVLYGAKITADIRESLAALHIKVEALKPKLPS